jgi:hypothetical protein
MGPRDRAELRESPLGRIQAHRVGVEVLDVAGELGCEVGREVPDLGHPNRELPEDLVVRRGVLENAPPLIDQGRGTALGGRDVIGPDEC